MAGRIHGKHGEVSIDPTGGSTPVPIASVDSWDLDLAKDRVDVTCFQDVNKQTVLGLPSYSGSLSGCWDSATTPEQLFDVIFGDVSPFLKLVPDTLDAAYFFSGLANIDGAISVSAKGAVTWSGKFDAAGPWSMDAGGVLLTAGRRAARAAEREQERARSN